MKQIIFYISDGTGITAETLGHTLVTQFENLDIESITIPYVDTIEKAHSVVKRINDSFKKNNSAPLLMATIINNDIRKIISESKGNLFEFFSIFLQPLSNILKQPYTHITGKSHGIFDKENYKERLNAINLSLTCDDGIGLNHYKEIDIILIGPSRAGKTPTCLYLALQFGLKAANYPLIEKDLTRLSTPEFIENYHDKIFGFLIDPNRLQLVREERTGTSKYASKTQCIWEYNKIEKFYKINKIPYINATNLSIEEMATKALEVLNISRKFI
ncbi:MAG: pyruvate, phosphate dikinase/phosphoenolpyruvate synthase regulator [Legionellales bacterium]|nr:pyruvate, phosphate dikinase/phosphoenolpyruvate synthase regulator [Legionellales bacterium]